MTTVVAKIKEEIQNLSEEERAELREEISGLLFEEHDLHSEFTAEEIAEIEAGIARGEADIAAGRVYSAQEMKRKWNLK